LSCTVFVLSGRGLCDGPIPRPEESYRLWCVSECDQMKIKQPRHLLWVGRRGKDYETINTVMSLLLGLVVIRVPPWNVGNFSVFIVSCSDCPSARRVSVANKMQRFCFTRH
jgi:hypothetical protein